MATQVKIAAAASLTDALHNMEGALLGLGIEEVEIFQGSSGYIVNRILGISEPRIYPHIFMSAATYPMNELIGPGYVSAANVTNLLGNDLVLIKNKNHALPVAINSFGEVTAANTTGVSIYIPQPDDPYFVPAGKYAEAAFTIAGNWGSFVDNPVHFQDSDGGGIYNVRRALELVAESGGPAIGVVYRTDAMVNDNVEIIAVADQSVNDTIIYPLAPINRGSLPEEERADENLVKDFVNFLKGAGLQYFTDLGFRVLI